MKYGAIPKLETMIRLINISFCSPDKNLAMYRIYSSLKEHQRYIENEKSKLLKRYGAEVPGQNGLYRVTGNNVAEYQAELDTILNFELNDDIQYPGITAEDFSSENCSYPAEKELWPSVADIATFIEFCEGLKKESGD